MPQEKFDSMPLMEHRSSFITCFFLFLILLALPYFSRGELEGLHSSEEIYEIDYKGPETHSSVPPPQRNHSARQKSLGLMGGATHTHSKVRKVHV